MRLKFRSTPRQGFLLAWLLIMTLQFVWCEPARSAEADTTADTSIFILGPTTGSMGSLAEIAVPEGFAFTGKEGAQMIMESTHNLVGGDEVGFMAPVEGSWWMLFEYDDCGYVRDDEGADLDADAILANLREGTEKGNEERAKRGWEPLTILGWEQPPHYDKESHSLEWATRLISTDSIPTINYNTRRLGRLGVMRITLVADPDSLAGILPVFKSTLAGFQYMPGRKYAEFKEGDKLAEYGLTALIVGGGAAVAAKTGAFKWIWKLLVAGVAAAGAFAKKLFGKKDSGPKAPPAYPGT